jgi:hypothetical protein
MHGLSGQWHAHAQTRTQGRQRFSRTNTCEIEEAARQRNRSRCSTSVNVTKRDQLRLAKSSLASRICHVVLPSKKNVDETSISHLAACHCAHHC